MLQSVRAIRVKGRSGASRHPSIRVAFDNDSTSQDDGTCERLRLEKCSVQVLRKSAFHLLFILPKFMPPKRRLSIPNEDFGWRNKRWNQDFRSTFQGCEYSILATNHRKVSRKSWFHLLFLLPKSSFGEHKFRTHYLTKELAYVSTQRSGQLNTFLLNHLGVYWKVAWLSTHVCKFLR